MSTVALVSATPLALAVMMIALVWRSPLPGRRFLALIFVEMAIAYGVTTAEAVGILPSGAATLIEALNYFYGLPSLYLFASLARKRGLRHPLAHYIPFSVNGIIVFVVSVTHARTDLYFLLLFALETLQFIVYGTAIALIWKRSNGTSESRLSILIASCYAAYYGVTWATSLASPSIPHADALPGIVGVVSLMPIAYRILRNPGYLQPTAQTTVPTPPPRYGGTELAAAEADTIVDKAKAYLAAAGDLSDASISPRLLAAAIGAPYYLVSRAVNERTGESVGELINRERVKRALLLLRASSCSSIIDIGYDCGFSAKSSFNTVFKRIMGKSPSSYRAEIAKSGAGRSEL